MTRDRRGADGNGNENGDTLLGWGHGLHTSSGERRYSGQEEGTCDGAGSWDTREMVMELNGEMQGAGISQQ